MSATIGHDVQGRTFSGFTQHMELQTVKDDKQVRINSRSYTQASGGSIGFQSKPSQTVTTTGDVIGGEVSPRVQSAIGFGTAKGLHVDFDMKGTGGGNGTNVWVTEIECIAPASSGRTISGDIAFTRYRSGLEGITVSGHVVPIKVAPHEGRAWDGLVKVPVNTTLAAKQTGSAALPANVGWIRVVVTDADGAANPVAYKLPLYND